VHIDINDSFSSSASQDPEGFEKAAEAPAAAAPTPKAVKKTAAVDDDEDGFETVGATKGKPAAPPVSSEGIYKALAQVMEQRGRKVSISPLSELCDRD